MKRLLTSLKAKLRSRAGETISETLVALLIGSLALVMLAGAISTSTRLVLRSKAKIDEYNATIEKVVNQTVTHEHESDEPEEESESSDYFSNTGKVFIVGDSLSVEEKIAYFESDLFAKTPVIAYSRIDE